MQPARSTATDLKQKAHRHRRGFVRVWAQVTIALCGVATIGLKVAPALHDEPGAAGSIDYQSERLNDVATSRGGFDGGAEGAGGGETPGAVERPPSLFAAVEVRYVEPPPNADAEVEVRPDPLPRLSAVADHDADPQPLEIALADPLPDAATPAATPRTLGPTDVPAQVPALPEPVMILPEPTVVDAGVNDDDRPAIFIRPDPVPADPDDPATADSPADEPAPPVPAPPDREAEDVPPAVAILPTPNDPAMLPGEPEAVAPSPEAGVPTAAGDTGPSAEAPAPPNVVPVRPTLTLDLTEPIDYTPVTRDTAEPAEPEALAPPPTPPAVAAPPRVPDVPEVTPVPDAAVSRPDRITNTLGMTFSRIPAGTFTMGSPEDERDRSSDEESHRVVLTANFYLAQTEVTQGQWEAVMDTTIRQQRHIGDSSDELDGIGDTHPMKFVTFADALAFCRKLGEMDGQNYRLPTEAEWEYACRAGTTTPYHTGSRLHPAAANFDGDISRGRTVEVAGFAPNAWGLHDMHGNVREWVADYYEDDFYEERGATLDPTGPAEGDERVLRGGSWNDDADEARSAARHDADPREMGHTIGFRVVLVPQ